MDSNLFGQHWKIVHPETPLYGFKSNKAFTIHQMLRESGDFFTVSETERQKVKMFELNEEAVQKFQRENQSKESHQSTQAESESVVEDLTVNLKMEAAMISEDSSSAATVPSASDKLYVRSPASSVTASDDARSVSPGTASSAGPQYSEVPVHGKARMSSHDRRLRVKPVAAVRPVERLPEDDVPAAPQHTANDALRRPVISLYNSWAVDGRDVVMEVTHSSSFDEMFALIAADREAKGVEFSAMDAGCGNGWAARKLAAHPLCSRVVAVDGAALMISKARASDPGSASLNL
jgi:hypothetical protein